ncbi:MAG: Calx-beta domain-containing protein, partial [Candidatus Omnitrophica bacterium]|nr:Calx-beta domain-containing protein [Candidatus Omnitrophota bacterium]
MVTNTADDGTGSLRQAIQDSNSSFGEVDTIEFNISGDGPHSIQPMSALPTLTDPVVIDGFTQGAATPQTSDDAVPNSNPPDKPINAVLKIEIDGSLAGAGATCFYVTGGGTVIRGLAINRFQGVGVYIQFGGGNRIEGNFIGTDVAGAIAVGNGADGVAIVNSSDNLIGGPDPEDRNLISANFRGMGIFESTSIGNTVQGNFIGTDATGSSDLGNEIFGIHILGAANVLIGGLEIGMGNLVSGNDRHGINLSRDSSNIRIQGNFVGTDLVGTTAIGNSLSGVRLLESSSNLIGGATPGASNLISGNEENGVFIEGPTSTQNRFENNRIGSNLSGLAGLGNGHNGISSASDVGPAQSFLGNTFLGNDLLAIDVNDDGVSANDSDDAQPGNPQ